MRNLSVRVSNAFRILVAIHLICLYVLFFAMRNTLFGFWHDMVAIGLTLLMIAIVALFIWDMTISRDAARKSTRLVDGLLGGGWLCLVGSLILNSMRSGIW